MTRALLATMLVACALAPVAGAISMSLSPTSTSTSTVTLNGVDQSRTATVTVTVTGATQSGWKITAWAPAPTSGSKSLPALDVPSQPTLGTCGGFGCTNPTPTGISWPVSLGTTSGGATKIYNASAFTGDGTITLHVPFGVTVPANALSGTYSTTITLTITNAGP